MRAKNSIEGNNQQDRRKKSRRRELFKHRRDRHVIKQAILIEMIACEAIPASFGPAHLVNSISSLGFLRTQGSPDPPISRNSLGLEYKAFGLLTHTNTSTVSVGYGVYKEPGSRLVLRTLRCKLLSNEKERERSQARVSAPKRLFCAGHRERRLAYDDQQVTQEAGSVKCPPPVIKLVVRRDDDEERAVGGVSMWRWHVLVVDMRRLVT